MSFMSRYGSSLGLSDIGLEPVATPLLLPCPLFLFILGAVNCKPLEDLIRLGTALLSGEGVAEEDEDAVTRGLPRRRFISDFFPRT